MPAVADIQNGLAEEFKNNPNVEILMINDGTTQSETYSWLQTLWNNYYCNSTIAYDTDGTVSDTYEQANTGLPFGRSFLIDQQGNIVLAEFGYNPALVKTKIYELLSGTSLNAEFEASITSGSTPLEVQFTDLSSDSENRDILSWEWDFDGNGSIDSSEQNPNYIYNEEGFYSVSLTVNNGVNTNTETKTDFIAVNLTGTDSETIQAVTSLSANYPNPFNPTTTISFEIAQESEVKLEIYNTKGQRIKLLMNEEISMGNHNVTWNGTDSKSNAVSSGIYFYKLSVNNEASSVKKCILLK